MSFHYDYQGHNKGRFEWYVLCCIVFILISGLRYRLGVDSTRYDYQFINTPSLTELWSFNYDETRFAPGYLLFNSIARSLSDSFVMMQILHAIFINILIFRFFFKNTPHIFVSVLLYFLLLYFNYNFEILRESCAIVIFLYAWKYFKTNEWVKYYICCIFAILFHPSALFLLILPLFYLPIFRVFFKMGLTFWITAGGVFVLSSIIAVKFFDVIQMANIASLEDYAISYENSDLAESKNLNMLGMITFFLRVLLYPIIAIALLKGSKYIGVRLNLGNATKEKLEYLLCWFVYISIISLYIKLFYRFNNYLYPFWILILSDILFSKIRYIQSIKRFSFGIWMVCLLPYLSLSLYGYFSDDMGSGIKLIKRYYPYSSVLNPTKDEKREQLFRYLGGN
ncbi:MAG: EpsG family protein [Muribaculaceae bacterium]|nr:EpsG family protein [Muribaculaceae bacterium]